MIIPEKLDLSPNKNGALVGDLHFPTGLLVTRSGAHWYHVPSRSGAATEYTVYAERISPAVYRCSCPRFIGVGICHHGAVALACEKAIRRTWPKEYRAERARSAVHLAAARKHRPSASWNVPGSPAETDPRDPEASF